MSETQPIKEEIPPEVLGEWELTDADREILGISDPNTNNQEPKAQKPISKAVRSR